MAYATSWVNNTPANPCAVTIAPTAGHLLIGYAISDDATANDFTTPAGWTLVGQINSTVDGACRIVCRKIATGSETSVSFLTSTHASIAGVIAFSGIDQTTPLDVTPVSSATPTAASVTNDDLSITPVTNGCDIVFVEGRDAGTGDYAFTFSTTSGTTGAWTTRTDQNSGFHNIASGSAVQTTAGAITARAASTSGGALGTLFALRPAVGAIVLPTVPTMGRLLYILP